jgi:diguanylate cyclase (GGDEF)-like protein
MINCLVIILSLMSRGVSLHRALLTSTQHKQELLIQHNLMEKLSKMDALTDLYNHKTFHEHMTRLLDQPDPQVPVHLALLDIDNFKQINDTYGHWAGDQVLKRISETIRNHMTEDDFAFRFGGEEFAVLFTHKTPEDSYAVLERIRKEFSDTLHDELNGGTVSVSIGLQSYRPDMGRERFFKDADDCLYEAKRTGKNRVVFQNANPNIRFTTHR